MASDLSSVIAPRSARSRVQKHLLRQKIAANTLVAQGSAGGQDGSNSDDGDPDPNRPANLDPGQMKLYSYYGLSVLDRSTEYGWLTE